MSFLILNIFYVFVRLKSNFFTILKQKTPYFPSIFGTNKQQGLSQLQKQQLNEHQQQILQSTNINHEIKTKSKSKSKHNDRHQSNISQQDTSKLNDSLLSAFQNKCSLSSYKDMLADRSKLPVYTYKQQIVKLINSNQVIVVSGATGSGK
jgi:HrpA-like RNA helicase